MSPKVGNADKAKAAQKHEKFMAAVTELYSTEKNYVQLLEFTKEVYQALCKNHGTLYHVHSVLFVRKCTCCDANVSAGLLESERIRTSGKKRTSMRQE